MTSRNHQLTLISIEAGSKNPQFMKILIHIGYISENAILMKFFVILTDIP